MNLDNLRGNTKQDEALKEAFLFGLGGKTSPWMIRRWCQEIAERLAIKVDLDCTMVHVGRLLR